MIRIEVEHIYSGQPRPYADTETSGRVKFLRQIACGSERGSFEPAFTEDDEQLRAILRALPCGFTDKEPECWASARLTRFTQVSPGVWEFTVTTPFTD